MSFRGAFAVHRKVNEMYTTPTFQLIPVHLETACCSPGTNCNAIPPQCDLAFTGLGINICLSDILRG